VLVQLNKELRSGIAAAAAKLNSSEQVRHLSRRVVAAAMLAVCRLVEAQEGAPVQCRLNPAELAAASEQERAVALPALCHATRDAVVQGVFLFVDSMASTEQLAGKTTKLLQEDGQAETRVLSAASRQQVYGIIGDCIKDGIVGLAATDAFLATLGQAAAARCVAEAAAAVSDSAVAAALSKITPEARVRAKYQGAGIAQFPASLVRGLCIWRQSLHVCSTIAYTSSSSKVCHRKQRT
jgi:hypothetical protein